MAENPPCGSKDGCRHPFSLHRKKVGGPCAAMGCKCQSFVAAAPAKSVKKGS